ncbi:MAG TPA: hypothetical protein PKA90_00855 [Ignavibacteria bacterium]|nr:hypothetical protein [Ignavibacteria bacterium]HMR38955.1 hypothetical protein [Ignavibacteria bacterium]
MIKESEFKNQVSFSKKQLAFYFTTQSNIISAVEKNETSNSEAEGWLDNELNSFLIMTTILRQFALATG